MIKEKKAKPPSPQKPQSTKLRHRYINKQEEESVLDSASRENARICQMTGSTLKLRKAEMVKSRSV